MNSDTLSGDIAAERARIDRAATERNRIDALRDALSEHRDRRDRGVAEDPPGDLLAAFDALLAPGADETPRDRREALGLLAEPAIPAADLEFADADGRLSFFEAAAGYRRTDPVSDALWRFVEALRDHVTAGDPGRDALVDRFESLVGGPDAAVADDLEHLQNLLALAADAAAGYRDAAAERLNTQYDADGSVRERGLVERFVAAAEEDPIETLEEQPVALLPVGLETRFVDGELLIRVYPDGIHVDAHEDALTDEEVAWAENFWAQVWLACHPTEDGTLVGVEEATLPSDRLREVVARLRERVESDAFPDDDAARYEEVKERAWGQLLERFDRERAAFLVQETAPGEGADALLDGPLAAGEVPELSFPAVPRRPESWTRPPTAELLPDRWVAYGAWVYESDDGDVADRRVVRVTGNAIREPLRAGPDPETAATTAVTGDGSDDVEGGVPAGMEWMVDFAEAERAGMALRITDADVFGREGLALDEETAAELARARGFDERVAGEWAGRFAATEGAASDEGSAVDETASGTVADEAGEAGEGSGEAFDYTDAATLIASDVIDATDEGDGGSDGGSDGGGGGVEPAADAVATADPVEPADPETLTDGYFETLVVLGVKSSMGPEESARRLRELLDAHHYTDGLAFLEQGTPTNNAEAESGYSSADDPEESVAVEAGPPLVSTADHSDGDVLARALGIDPAPGEDHVFAHVENADRTEGLDARHMNSVLWPGTIGYYVRNLFVPNVYDDLFSSIWRDPDAGFEPPEGDQRAQLRDGLEWLESYRRHFVRYVRARGPFPALRVGEQPYGLLPVTPVSTTVDAPVDLSPEAASDALLSIGTATGAWNWLGGGEEGDEGEEGEEGDEEVLFDGGEAGSFVPRSIVPKSGEEFHGSLATWLARFGDEWGAAVDRSPVPRVGAGDGEGAPEDVLEDVLSRDPSATRFTKRQYLSDVNALAAMVALVEDDVDLWVELSDTLEEARRAQVAEIRRTLEANDATSLDPRIAHLVFQPFTGEEDATSAVGDIARPFVDDGVGDNLWLLAGSSYGEIRTMGYEFDPREYDMDPDDPDAWRPRDDVRRPSGEESSTSDLYEQRKVTAARRKAKLIKEKRAIYGGEPVVQKSLFRLLCRFSTLRAFFAARLRLGVLYDDLPRDDVAPGPVAPEVIRFGRAGGWDVDSELTEKRIPESLAEHPSLSPNWTYGDALSSVRRPFSEASDVDPRIGEFTASLYHLAGLSAPALEDLLAGTLDLASHRFDAWWTSLATRRLFELRSEQGNWMDAHKVDPGDLPFPFPAALSGLGVPGLPSDDDASADEGVPALESDRIVEAWLAAREDAPARAGESIGVEPGDWPASPEDATDEEDDDGSRTDGGARAGADARSGEAAGGIDATATSAGTGSSTALEEAAIYGTTRYVGDDATGPAIGEAIDEEATSDEPGWVHDVAGTALTPVEEAFDPATADAGIYVGGYAFGEDLRPDDGDGEAAYALAPSLQQATTAALLRAGYDAHADDELGETFAVDLSAERVRTARRLLAGVRQGMTLGELLGYRFERSLHERGLSEYVHDFREEAPAIEGRLERTEGAAGPGEDPAARSDVVDGYRLFRRWKELKDPSLEVGDVVDAADDAAAVTRRLEALEDAVDAVGDLVLAENVHQLAGGNVERAGASLGDLAEGKPLPETEVERTPRSSTGVTHRTMLLFGDADADAAGWPDEVAVDRPELPDVSGLYGGADEPAGATGTGALESGLQVRPAAEPRLDAWLADLLVDPRTVEFGATYHWEVPVAGGDADAGAGGSDGGAGARGDDGGGAGTEPRSVDVTATLADLDCSPLDLLALLGGGEEAGPAPLEGHLAYYLLRTRGDHDDAIPPDATVEIRTEETASEGAASLAAVLGALRSAKGLVADGRPIDGSDLTLPAEVDDQGAFDAEALASRAGAAQRSLASVRDAVGNRLALLDPADEEPSITELVDDVDAAAAGFADAVPLEAIDDAAESLSGETLLEELGAFAAALPVGPGAGGADREEVVVEPDAGQTVSGTLEPVGGTRHAVGTFRTPASSGRVSVTDVGFEPDVLVLTASATTAGPDEEPSEVAGAYGWSHGKVARRPDGTLAQNALCVASDSHSTNSATGASTTDAAVALVLHDDGEAGRVTGTVVATRNDGFEVEFEVAPGGRRAADRFAVTYEAIELPEDARAGVGHFVTPTEPGSQTVPLPVDADRVALTATNLVGRPDGTVETSLTAGISHGEAVGRADPDQRVVSGSFEPSNIDHHSYAAHDDRALSVLFQTGERVDGRTRAAVTSLGRSIELAYDEAYGDEETVPGPDAGRVVTYLAVDTGGDPSPALGHVPTPDAPGEVEVETGFRPALVEFAATPAVGAIGSAAAGELEGTTAGGPFGWSHGTALDADGAVRERVLSDGVNSRSTNAHAGASSTDAAISLLYVDRDGRVTGRDRGRVARFTDTGFVVEFTEVASRTDSAAEVDRALVCYTAWPATDARVETGDRDVELRLWRTDGGRGSGTDSGGDGGLPMAVSTRTDGDGSFAADVDFSAVPPGTRFRVAGVLDGRTVYSRAGRVRDDRDVPAAGERLADAYPVTARLLWLGRVLRAEVDPAGDGAGSDLNAALAAVEALGGGRGWEAVDGERGLIEGLLDAAGGSPLATPALEEADRDAVEALLALGRADADPAALAGALSAVLRPIDRLGIPGLVGVQGPPEDPGGARFTVARGTAEDRARIERAAADPAVLAGDAPDPLLSVAPGLAAHVRGWASEEDAVAFVRSLRAFVDCEDWLPAYLDAAIDDPAFAAPDFLADLAALAYRPGALAARLDRFRPALAAFESRAADLPYLDDCFSDVEGDASPASARRAFLEGLAALSGSFDELARDEASRSDARERFAADFDGRAADPADGSDDDLAGTAEALSAVLDATPPEGAMATSFRAGALEALRIALVRASYFGVYGSVPASAAGGSPADERALVEQARAVHGRLAERVERAAALAPSPDPTAEGQRERLKALFGESFEVLPPFVPPGAEELSLAFSGEHQQRLLEAGDPLAPETWLGRIARVRDRPAGLQETYTIAEALSGRLHLDLRVGQLPYRWDDDWVGLDGVEPGAGRLSLVAQLATGSWADVGTGPIAGVMVDEWAEQVPAARETAGLALEHDAPGQRPPQSILLATPPASGEWSRGELETALLETMDLLKIRAVDLDDLDELGHLLPALCFPLSLIGHPPFGTDPRGKVPSVDFDVLERFRLEALPLGLLNQFFAWDDGEGGGEEGGGADG